MFNLKKGKSNYKGWIGECMFKLTDKSVELTRFFVKQKYLRIFGKYFSKNQKEFLNKYWYSLDAIKISFDKKKEN